MKKLGPDELQRMIRQAFLVALEHELSDHTDFFEAGGDSIAAESVLTYLSDQLQVELPGWLLLDYPTISSLRAVIEGRSP